MRATTLLQTVTPAERAAIEEIAYAIAAKVVDCVLDEAARCAPLAARLAADLPAAASDRVRLRRSPDSTARPEVAGASVAPVRLG